VSQGGEEDGDREGGVLGIGELADASGVPVTTLRYYDQVGLVAPARREGGRRRYDDAAVGRLQVIRWCKAAGFTLDEIVVLFGDRSPGRRRSRALATARLETIAAQMAELAVARRILELGLRCECVSLDACACPVHDELAGLAAVAAG
jgi:DNA-binding transcriptional MerR regulator